MKPQEIKRAVILANLFIKRAGDYQAMLEQHPAITEPTKKFWRKKHPKESAALRRVSMELTRQLAVMRA